MHLRHAILISLTLGAATLAAQSAVDADEIAATVTRQVEKFLRHPTIRSASVGIHLRGVTYTGHFGHLDGGDGPAPTDASRYEIGSVTKTMVGYLIAEAVANGRLSLEDDVRNYLPDAYPNLELEGKGIQLRHLLTHTAGLPPHLPQVFNGVYETLAPDVPRRYRALEEQYGKEEFLADLRKVELTSVPGTSYAYSSAGMELLAIVLESVNRQPLATQLGSSLFERAGMDGATLFQAPTDTTRRVRGYWMENTEASPTQYASLWGGGTGVVATLPDLLRYAILQLDKADSIVARSQEILYYDGGTRWMAYGWSARKDRYGTSYHHHGGTSGIQNWTFVFPEQQLSLVVITNHSGPDTPARIGKLARQLLKQLL